MQWKMMIAGEELAAQSGRTFERRSPATGEVVGVYPEAAEADVARAIEAARRVFDDGKWTAVPARARAATLRKLADLVRRDGDAIAETIAIEVGKPLALAKGEVGAAAEVIDYYAALALDVHGEVYSHHQPDAIGLALREPVGVVAMITPWNFPLYLIAIKLAPALAAGCTAVAKPSHLTPGSTLQLARLVLEAGVPPGVFNVVTGEAENGAVVGQTLVNSPMVDKISFTGSTATGKKIAAAAASSLKRVSLELGGKSPNVVFADVASLDAAAAGAYSAIYMNSGQVCQAGSRLLVQESIKDALLEKLVAMTKSKVKLGGPLEAGVNMGPIVSEPQLARVLSYLESGKQSAELVTGGGRATAPALARGLFVEPTIFDKVAPSSTIAREEIFGPVLSVMTFKDADDALRLANDTLYGLAAAVWTKDLTQALKMAKGIKAGTLWINAYHGVGIGEIMPYGGFKQSGLGRELGHRGLEEYQQVKSVHIKLR
jgi:acyl-CoA reductase-like NAD-dependent aldehyde dehydrogenase